jgi:hypothetical protein
MREQKQDMREQAFAIHEQQEPRSEGRSGEGLASVLAQLVEDDQQRQVDPLAKEPAL